MEQEKMNIQLKKDYFDKIMRIIRLSKNTKFVKKPMFNTTEMKMLEELSIAKMEGRRLISSNLAKALGVTRSAVSQMVTKLEKQGIVKRVAAENDKKIAYIELTESYMNDTSEQKNMIAFNICRTIDKMGEDNFEKFIALGEEFFTILNSLN